MDRQRADVVAEKSNGAAVQARVAHHGGEQRGLANAIAAEHGERRTGRQRQRDAVEDDGFAVARAHVVQSQRLSGVAGHFGLRSPR